MELRDSGNPFFVSFILLKYRYDERGKKMQNYRNNMRNYMAYDTRGYAKNSRCTEGRNMTGQSEKRVLAMAYVPWQEWRNIYEPGKAFCRGTIFEELDKPFYGVGGGCR